MALTLTFPQDFFVRSLSKECELATLAAATIVNKRCISTLLGFPALFTPRYAVFFGIVDESRQSAVFEV
jgi:hypothetical protein